MYYFCVVDFDGIYVYDFIVLFLVFFYVCDVVFIFRRGVVRVAFVRDCVRGVVFFDVCCVWFFCNVWFDCLCVFVVMDVDVDVVFCEFCVCFGV